MAGSHDAHLQPPSGTALERGLSNALQRATALDVLIRDEWSPARCPAELLPWLAWAMAVEDWSEDWSIEQKRAVIARSIELHRYKGTFGAVQEALKAFALDVRVQEWFAQTPVASPYTFKVQVNINQSGIKQTELAAMMAQIQRAKNLRSHLDEVKLTISSGTGPHGAAVVGMGAEISMATYTPPALVCSDMVLCLPPTLAALEAYRIPGTNSWRNVPWGPVLWREQNINFGQWVDIDLPDGEAPADGWPFIVRLPASGGVHTVPTGSTVGQMIKAPALSRGIAFLAVSARHPQINATATDTPDDLPVFWAWLTEFAHALRLDMNRASGFTQSRGSMLLLAALRHRQIKLLLLWSVNPQVSYRSADLAPAILATPEDVALALIDTPDDPRQYSAFKMVDTAANAPNFVALYDAEYAGRKLSYSEYVGYPSGSTHFPDQGLLIKKAYNDAGLADRCITADRLVGNANVMADMVPTLIGMLDGMSLPDAAAVARAWRRGHSIYYLTDDLSGTRTVPDATGVTPALGQRVGALVDGRFGPSYRDDENPPGNHSGQQIANNRPTLVLTASGKYALSFDFNDRLISQKENEGAPDVAVWSTTGVTRTALSVAPNNIAWGIPNEVVVLSVVSATAIPPEDLRFYTPLASKLAGNDLFNAI